jgi:hypothetical protein
MTKLHKNPKPKKALVTLEPAQAEELGLCATNIINNYRMAKNCAAQAVVYAAKCGAVLNRAKELSGHGAFGKWLANNCPVIGHSTAAKYMSLAESLTKSIGAKFPSGGNLKLLEMPDPRELTDKSNDRLVDSIKRATEGKTLTELYTDFGICKERKKKGSEADAKRKAKIGNGSKENEEGFCQESTEAWEDIGANLALCLPKANPDQVQSIIKVAIAVLEQATQKKVTLV